ncbi:hypothetical protein I2I11_19930 [Pontibacter sp. 172403-2]|uniref:nuclease A inhibitor family protein n=1 Tax=Pontibacter rufus TaxID=2791028 RepID=UPI0018B00A1A|nr:nuclease A inhibitor family protein [Pontibacter sp. 172403-2]MBF9255579.1 hypothetical protein [Pontibacter sp. 172403-2]
MRNMSKEELQQELMSVAGGLLLKSEIEAPFEFVYYSLRPGQQFAPETVAEWAGKPAGMAVDTKNPEAFRNKIKGIVPVGATSGDTSSLYQQLAAKLNELLDDVQVYSITQIGTEVYMLGKTGTGAYAGLRTMAMIDEATID